MRGEENGNGMIVIVFYIIYLLLLLYRDNPFRCYFRWIRIPASGTGQDLKSYPN